MEENATRSSIRARQDMPLLLARCRRSDSENYMVEFVVPHITHEERALHIEQGGFLKRTGYALSAP